MSSNRKRSFSADDLASLASAHEDMPQGPKASSSRLSVSSPSAAYARNSATAEHSNPTSNPNKQDLVRLANCMQKELSIKDRRLNMRWHKDCFRGSRAVTWLVNSGGAPSREAAVKTGSEMLGLGLFHHVTHNHGFMDRDRRLYRFSRSEILRGSSSDLDASEASSIISEADRVQELYDSMWSRKSVVTPSHAKSGKWSLGSEVAQLQGRTLDLSLDIEDQKEMSGILLDAISEQIRGMQNITRLLVDKMAIEKQRLARLQMLLTMLALVQLFNLAWLAGRTLSISSILLLLTPSVVVALAAIAASLWILFKSGTVQNSDFELLGSAASLGDEPIWEGERSATAASEDVAAGRRILEQQADRIPKSPTTGPPELRHEEQTFADKVKIHPKPSSTLRRITEDSVASTSNADSSGHSESTAWQEGVQDDPGPPSTSSFTDWPDAPLLLRPKALSYQRCEGLVSGGISVNTGRPLKFETELFKGCAVIWVQGLSTAPKDLFAGHRRKTSITVQGCFKQPLYLDDLITGQEFDRPAVNLPSKWLVESVLVKIARSISPSMAIGPMSAPYCLVPVVAAAQEICVSQPGEEPDPSQPFMEDMRLFDDTLVDKKGGPLDSAKRKKLFWDAKKRKGRQVTTEHVWTLTMYQQQVDMSKYQLDVGLRFDLARHLDGQPLQFQLKDRASGSWLFNFEAWHEKLLPAAQRAEGQQL